MGDTLQAQEIARRLPDGIGHHRSRDIAGHQVAQVVEQQTQLIGRQ
jgi:hypothetical protein